MHIMLPKLMMSLLLAASVGCASVWGFYKSPQALKVVTQKGTFPFFIEVAENDADRRFGLMEREFLDVQAGMLFDFQQEREVSFWMRNTLIGLDIIFIKASGEVAHIHPNAVPLDESPIPSTQPVRYVLEINAGLAKQMALKPGDTIVHPLIQQNEQMAPQ